MSYQVTWTYSTNMTSPSIVTNGYSANITPAVAGTGKYFHRIAHYTDAYGSALTKEFDINQTG